MAPPPRSTLFPYTALSRSHVTFFARIEVVRPPTQRERPDRCIDEDQGRRLRWRSGLWSYPSRSDEHTSELQSQSNIVCRLMLEKKYDSISRNRTTLYHAQM